MHAERQAAQAAELPSPAPIGISDFYSSICKDTIEVGLLNLESK